MREIKFRAWNSLLNIMLDCNRDNSNSLWNPNMVFNKCFKEHQKAGIILLQFTGLKDKNGKEIYEGDIVEWIIIGEKDEDVEGIRVAKKMGIYEVFFENGKFIIPKPPIPIGHINTECKVIGNIYENPELIK